MEIMITPVNIMILMVNRFMETMSISLNKEIAFNAWEEPLRVLLLIKLHTVVMDSIMLMGYVILVNLLVLPV